MLRLLLLSIAALVGPPSMAAGEGADMFASLHRAVTVDGRVVTLGDVAVVTARDQAESAKCRNVEVARPTSLAAPLRLKREVIARRIDADYPECAGRLLWGGSNDVVVAGRPQRVDLDAATNAAAALVMERLGGGDHVSLRLLEGPTAVEVPIGVARSRPDAQAVLRNGAYVAVPVIVEVDGVPVARPVLRFAVSRNPLFLQASPAGSLPTMPVAELPVTGGVSQMESYTVERNQAVTLFIEDEGLRIESEGIAMSSAREGEKIRVRRRSGGAELAGRVVAHGVVRVEGN